MYYDELLNANEFTKNIGLCGRNISPAVARRYLDEPDFFTELGKYLKFDKPDELIANCNIVSQLVCEAINDISGCKAYLTIGDVESGHGSTFNMTQSHIVEVLKMGKKLSIEDYRHHAWITLDSMEIIDFTYLTSIAFISKDLSNEQRLKYLGAVISGHADELKNGLKFKPILIGEEFYIENDEFYVDKKRMYTSLINSKSGNSHTEFTST